MAVLPASGPLEARVRVAVEAWLDDVQARRETWLLLFRDTGGGAEVAASHAKVHTHAREVLVEFLRVLGGEHIPEPELEPLAELLSLGQAAVVLWWIDHPELSRSVVLDAIGRPARPVSRPAGSGPPWRRRSPARARRAA